MDLELTEEQQQLQNAAIEFARSELNDDVIRRDRDEVFSFAEAVAFTRTVLRETSPRYGPLIERLALAGVSVLLKTSFNLKGEPMLNKPANTSHTFLKSEMAVLALGNFFIQK